MESVDMELKALMWFQHKEEEKSNGRWKKVQSIEGAHWLEPQKAYPTNESILVW